MPHLDKLLLSALVAGLAFVGAVMWSAPQGPVAWFHCSTVAGLCDLDPARPWVVERGADEDDEAYSLERYATRAEAENAAW